MLCKMNSLILILIFSTMYPTAFTQDRSSPEHYCYLKSPIDSTIFNFTTIQNDDIDSIISLNNFHHLRIHFCMPLKDPCNGKQGYSVCLHDNDKEIGVGKEPPIVTVEFEKIMFKYKGDKCNETHDYTMDIEMKCNTAVQKLPHDMDAVYNREQCGFQMSVETSAACPKKKEVECDLIDGTGYYNFRPLINRVKNYEIEVDDNITVIMNICHSLLYGNHYHKCNHDTMVCLVNANNPEEPSYTRLGNINNRVNFFSYGRSVFMQLTSDTPCDINYPNITIKTTIEFICNENATHELPLYSSGLDTCHYRFLWVTAAACNELVLIKLSERNHEPCKIRDPLNDQWFDLSLLKENGSFENTETENAMYEFRVCGALKKSNCSKSGTGVCKYMKGQKIGVSKGIANADLMWRRGQILLNYTDGVGCGHHQRSYTTIYFNCAYFDSVEINDNDPCATIITWSTPKVCSHRCSTPDYKFNLLNLREQTGNYHIGGENKTIQYHLNICDPLLDQNYTNCTNGTGICKTIINDKGKIISELSLGSQVPGLKTERDGKIYLRYENGSVCEEDNSKNISTEITFTCDANMHAVGQLFLGLGQRFFDSDPFMNFQRMIKGTPVYKSYYNCRYNFNWMTSFVCPESNNRLSKECLVEDRYQVLNKLDAVGNSFLKVNAERLTGLFNVWVNDTEKKCTGSFICDQEPWVELIKPRPKGAKQLVIFKFANETQCPNDTFYNELVKVWCNVWAGDAKSFLLQNGECSIVLDWTKNNTIGKFRGNPKEGEEGKTRGFSAGTAAVYGFTFLALASFGLFCYLHYTNDIGARIMTRMRNYARTYMVLRRRPNRQEDIQMQGRS